MTTYAPVFPRSPMAEISSASRPSPDVDGRPDFLVRLGVLLPCNEEDVKAAYRTKVKTAHPDTGGSVEAFRQVEEDYQSALQFANFRPVAATGLAPTWNAMRPRRI